MPVVERSPRYPAYPLRDALQFARALYETEKRSVVPLESVSRALGHEMLSGTAKVKIATLRQFGLLEDVSRGKVRISDRAFTIIMKPSQEKFREALDAALATPSLFQVIRSQYPEASDQTLRYHLMHDMRFSEEGADRAIRAYRESQELANPSPKDYSGDDDADHEEASKDQRSSAGAGRSTSQHRPASGVDKHGVIEVAYTWPLPGGIDAQVILSGQPTPRAIDHLIGLLEAWKAVVDEPPPVEELPQNEATVLE